ncbi:MAG: DUF5696 domain-containing protein [Limisphaerales bacterium]
MKHLSILATALLAALPVLRAQEAPSLAAVETPFFRFTLSAADGRCEVIDKQAGVTWRAEANEGRFGQVTLRGGTTPQRVALARCVVQAADNELIASFQPVTTAPAAMLRVRARPLPDQRTLELSYEADPAIEVADLTLAEDVLGVTDSAKGYVVVPAREGLLVPADSGLSFTHRFDTYAYEGCHIEMLGVVRSGAAALVTWQDPYVAADLKSVVREGGAQANRPSAGASRQRLSPSLTLSKSARSFRISFLGRGDYVTIAKAYRQLARERGWLVTWDEKLKTNPEREKLLGAANIKLWSALDRRMNQESTREESARVNWTFDEAAQVAEHFKQDLKLDRVLFTVGGWIHRGYDNQHPDILPSAPECGGDAALADCAQRVLRLGYLFCLHDNYQDIYRDSPSWNEKFIMKTRDGQLARGGHWAGGMAYLTCSQMALDLARRPQNLMAVKKLCGANAYFIDTTYAAGLQECFDPAHPLTRADDLKWKQALSDYAREVFGVFGSECGREWAIPHSDFFEGLTGVSGADYHDAGLTAKLGATVVPLFELVYRDCIAMYGKYGYDPKRAAGYVLQHISLGRPLNYHAIPPHLYWKNPPPSQAGPIPAAGDAALFTRADGGWAEGLHPLDRFIKNTCEVLCPLNEMTARLPMTLHEFLTPDRKVRHSVFGEGTDATEVFVNSGATAYLCASKLGGQVELPPGGFLVESPAFVAFHASNWAGARYESPPLFTLRSLDRQPLSKSHRVRVYHGFGGNRISLGNTPRVVKSETVLDPNSSGREGP